MEPVTAYAFWNFLTLLKYIHVCPFRIISTMKSFLIYLTHWYLSDTVTKPAVHHPIKSSYPHWNSFRTNLRRFCPSIVGCFFWNNIPQFICPDTLLNTTERLPFHYLSNYFPSLFKYKSRPLLLYVVLRGITLVYLDVPFFFPFQNTM